MARAGEQLHIDRAIAVALRRFDLYLPAGVSKPPVVVLVSGRNDTEVVPDEWGVFASRARLFVGNDSGPSHLASAQGLPGVVIFGPSDPSIWGPLGPRTRVLRKVDQCDPRCSRRACFATYRCLHAVRPQEVLDTLLAQLADQQTGDAR